MLDERRCFAGSEICLQAEDALPSMASLQEIQEPAREDKSSDREGDEDATAAALLPPPPPVLRTQSSVQSIHEASVQRLVIIM